MRVKRTYHTDPKNVEWTAQRDPADPRETKTTLAAAAKSLQSCPILCDPIDGSPPGSPVPGILQASILEWVAISFSNAWKWKVKVKLLSRVRLLATPWTAAYQAPPSLGFSRQEHWSGLQKEKKILDEPLQDEAIQSTPAAWPHQRDSEFNIHFNSGQCFDLMGTFLRRLPQHFQLLGM